MCNAVNDSKIGNIDFIKITESNKAVNKNATIIYYNFLFKDKTFNIPLAGHERPFKEVKLKKEKINGTKGKVWRIEQYDYKTCPECGGELVAMDRSRGERICECGMTNKRVMMIADMDLQWQNTPGKLRTTEDSLTHEEKKVLKHIQRHDRQEGFKTGARMEAEMEKERLGKKYKHKKVQVKTSQNELNKKRYVRIVGTVASQLLMTKTQKTKVIEIINKYPLNLIHSRVNQQAIIAGICRYILLKDGRGKELRYNRSVFQFVGLTESSYNVIERNLKRLGI